MKAPLVFISYSHDSPTHKEWVAALATDLRTNGVDATLDEWDLPLGGDVVAFMADGIIRADRVLMICSEKYVSKAETGAGGVGYERLIVTKELVENIDTRKFIPVLRSIPGTGRVPNFLGPRKYIDLSVDADYDARLRELLRELLGAPATSKPPLGANPFSGSVVPNVAPARIVNTTGVIRAKGRVLDEPWFVSNAAHATQVADANGHKAHMEVRLALHEEVSKSQIELLNAVRASAIRTFGWPIGVLLENRDEFRPKPLEDGIRAEIPITSDALSGRSSYDLWTLRGNGDFYLLQSLFEDQRAEKALFFNTRIVRVTETLLFADNLYRNLGAPSGTQVSVRISHRGLKGRTLTSSGPRRHVSPARAEDNQSQSEIVVTVGSVREALVQDVMRITAPMFMLFDFTEFEESVYEDIVRRFERGEVT